MGDEWTAFLQGYLSVPQAPFWALGLGYGDDDNLGTLFSASNADGTDEWAPLYKEAYEAEVGGEKTQMDETAHLAKAIKAVEEGKNPPGSLFLGGEKYQVTTWDTEDVNGEKYVTVMIAAPGKGGAIVKGPTYFVIGLFEEKREQNKGPCRSETFKVCQAANGG